MEPRKIDWVNTIFIASAHLLAVAAVVYMVTVHFSWWTIGLGFVWLALCSISITGGYHRLFAHPTYKASRALRAFYLVFGAGSIQNSALKWSVDHRVHHSRCDQDEDPYNIRRGFWWAHIGWILHRGPETKSAAAQRPARDLSEDPLIQFQDRHYLALAILVSGVLPLALGFLWGDPIGALLVAGFLRLVLQWHATFAVNSVAHWIGRRPYSKKTSARDSFATALITLGEGYHNYHHRFQADYRNGIRWYHFDPTKWFIFSLSKVGVTRDLRRTPTEQIVAARQSV